MKLRSIQYSEFAGQEQEWILDGIDFDQINLLVGKNATGKTRTLNLIGGLAALLCGERTPALLSGEYGVTFLNEDKVLKYSLRMDNKEVVSESFERNGEQLLIRGAYGEGKIFAEKINLGQMIEFQTPTHELAAFVRRDSKQHSFLEPLHMWGSAARYYHFGTQLGKDNFAVMSKRGGLVPDGKSASEVVALFQRAKKDFPGSFVDAVVSDMTKVDYPIEQIGVGPLISIQIDSPFSGDLVGLWVKEIGLRGKTDQVGMSQGMFRVLSIIILTNYLASRGMPGSLIIDDIGEGLDFDRSCLLIDLLREKSHKSKLQLILSTNDKFVMNRVPLDEWHVLSRRGSRVTVSNHENSKEIFEEFRFTGLSNFSFFEMDFANQPV